MPKWLAKEYGPFTGTVWVVVIVGGVGLGLLMRRFVNRQPVEAPATTEAMVPGLTGGIFPGAMGGGGSLYNQGEIVSAVLEEIALQEPPPPTTEPEIPPVPPTPPPPPPPTKPAPKPKLYPELRPMVVAAGHNPASVVNESDVMAALRKIGHNPGSVLNTGDIDVLIRWYNRR